MTFTNRKLAPPSVAIFAATMFWLKKFLSFWLMPLPLCIVLMVGGLVLWRTRFGRLGRSLLVAGVGLLMVVSNKFVSRWLIRPLEAHYPAVPDFVTGKPLPPELARCEFVVVLGAGNGLSPDMAPTNLLGGAALARIVEAVRVAHALPNARLVLCGPGPTREQSHAMVLSRAAQLLGIAPQRIILLPDVHDTEDETLAAKKIAGDAPVALVTSAWHMPRSMALSRSAGLKAMPCPTDYRSHPGDAVHFDDLFWEVEALARTSLAIRERIGFIWITLRGKT